MKNLILFLLFFSIYCNGQGKPIKKCINGDSIVSRYQNIHTVYDNLIEKNRNNIYLRDNSYYFKSSNDAGNSDSGLSRLLLPYEGKNIFMKTNPNGNIYTTFENGKLIEETFFPNKENFELKSENFITHLMIGYYTKEKKLSTVYYGSGKEDIILAQLFKDCILQLEKNYKKDFKINKNELLKKLPQNFYNAAVQYLDNKKAENKIKIEEYEELKGNAGLIKKELEAGRGSNSEFFNKVYIGKTYSDDIPVYQVGLPKRLDGKFVNWLFEINAKNNTVYKISYTPFEF